MSEKVWFITGDVSEKCGVIIVTNSPGVAIGRQATSRSKGHHTRGEPDPAPAPRSGGGSALPGQRVFRRARLAPSQVRDAAPGGRRRRFDHSCGDGVRFFSSGVLRGSALVSERRDRRFDLAAARPSSCPQAVGRGDELRGAPTRAEAAAEDLPYRTGDPGSLWYRGAPTGSRTSQETSGKKTLPPRP